MNVLQQPLAPAPLGPTLDPPPPPPARRAVWPKRIGYLALVLFIAAILWLTITAPLSRSLQPIAPPTLTVLASDGQPIARRGAIIEDPVSVDHLPPYVPEAFIAIEDRRFFRHIGIDPWGIARATVVDLFHGGARQGGSTITQQLAKTSFTGGERTAGRKIQEAMISLWLELWLSKEQILSRYLSNVYFGDNVYGLRAAAHHYFSVDPEHLTIPQAAMLAGMVNAPTRLAPTHNLAAAQARSRLVMEAMEQAGFITHHQHEGLTPARIRVHTTADVPTGTYFADWVLPTASAVAGGGESYGEREIHTTLDRNLQRLAVRVIHNAHLGNTQAALVAMRPDGHVVAMIGGRDYNRSPFNRATQARRQAGSTFKLFVYLAALRSGMTPDSMIDDTPLTIGHWHPQNYGGTYRGRITLREAFAQSSNVAAVRVARQVGIDNVIRAARDLGVTAPLPRDPTIALGTAGVSLLELTQAFASVSHGQYPVVAQGLTDDQNNQDQGLLARVLQPREGSHDEPAFAALRQLLYACANQGTGRAAALAIPTFGKTGTTQDYRDALFIGYAGDLVVGVWVGNDDNRPMARVTGGSIPAQIWRNYMTAALDTTPAVPPQPVATPGDNTQDPTQNGWFTPSDDKPADQQALPEPGPIAPPRMPDDDADKADGE